MLTTTFRFTNSTSLNTVYSDTLYELDDVIGRITGTLKSLGLYNNTLTWFTGDNGPWDVKCQYRYKSLCFDFFSLFSL